MLLFWGETFVIAIIMVFFVTQITIPIIRGTVLFPSFRKTSNKLVAEAKEELNEAFTQAKAEEIHEKARKVRKKDSLNQEKGN